MFLGAVGDMILPRDRCLSGGASTLPELVSIVDHQHISIHPPRRQSAFLLVLVFSCSQPTLIVPLTPSTSHHTRNINPSLSFNPPHIMANHRLEPESPPRRTPKSGVQDLKLRRLNEANERLRQELNRPRTRASEASKALINYTVQTRDPLLPSIWGEVRQDPYAPPSQGCCTVM